jgi:hypothetical protein
VRERSLQILATLLLWTFVCGVLSLSTVRAAPSSHAPIGRHSQAVALLGARDTTVAPAAVASGAGDSATPALTLAIRLPAPRPYALSLLPPLPPPTPRTPVYLRQLVLLL